ncbi:hypothetical protein [Sphingomonas hylomeconis]|uniref:DUF350 domain-containing protein n=1 Tax=Sphingomonas hylomeconis TaxID=1395958 RepID=A0ABV7SXR0_9SPHN|nr:hypothetical protein [Sphingomonas hylomeconis]
MIAAFVHAIPLFAIAATLCVGLMLIVVGVAMLAIDLGEPAADKARIAVGGGAGALGLVLVIAGAAPLCRWLVIVA